MTETRPLRVLLVHPGASWSTADVYEGFRYGLQRQGVDVHSYRLDGRLKRSKDWLFTNWRKAKKDNPDIVKPNEADVIYQASIGALERALRLQVDCVIIVACRHFHPDAVVLLRRAGVPVTVLFTESPYDQEFENHFAAIVDGGWTTEKISVPEFRTFNPNFGYIQHGWHPERHFVGVGDTMPEAQSHDVVFVGSGFPERVTFFNSIDWSGIDLGLYGTWKGLGLRPELESCIKGPQIDNRFTAALYGKCKIGLNLYRKSKAFSLTQRSPRIERADSLSPRAYELAACGVFHLSEFRSEVSEVFGDLVPTFKTPAEASALIRHWLSDNEGRARVASQLPAVVAESSWVDRAACVIGDVDALLRSRRGVGVTAVAV